MDKLAVVRRFRMESVLYKNQSQVYTRILDQVQCDILFDFALVLDRLRLL